MCALQGSENDSSHYPFAVSAVILDNYFHGFYPASKKPLATVASSNPKLYIDFSDLFIFSKFKISLLNDFFSSN